MVMHGGAYISVLFAFQLLSLSFFITYSSQGLIFYSFTNGQQYGTTNKVALLQDLNLL